MALKKSLEKYLTHSLLIPRVGGAESLNVAVATGIIVNTLTERTQRG
jgi:tRNA G18 (ribose-2'-O)-methylase SpoU